MAVLLYVIGFACIVAGFPVEGLPGAGLALVGMLIIWAGWYRVIRRERRRAAR